MRDCVCVRVLVDARECIPDCACACARSPVRPRSYETQGAGVPRNRARHAMSAPFRSGVSRLAPLAPADAFAAPGPGAYEGAWAWPRACSAACVRACVRECVGASLTALPPRTCPPPRVPRRWRRRRRNHHRTPDVLTPRPRPPPVAAAGLVYFSNPNDGRALSSFANDGLDRFGHPVVRRTLAEDAPGPGAYFEVGTSAAPPPAGGGGRKKGPAGTSVFKSAAKRGELPGMPRPGPGACALARVCVCVCVSWPCAHGRPAAPRAAFYKPETVGKKSFLLNASRRFL